MKRNIFVRLNAQEYSDLSKAIAVWEHDFLNHVYEAENHPRLRDIRHVRNVLMKARMRLNRRRRLKRAAK